MTDWQNQYLTGQTPWDRGAPAPALLAYLATRKLSGRVLVPGCGTGQDVRAIAASGVLEVVGLDLAELAVARAKIVLAAQPTARVQLGDIFVDCHMPPLRESFDWVWEHTCYCAIPPQRRADYVAAMAAVLKPGGKLLGVFFLTPWDADEDQTQGPPFGTALDDLKTMLGQHFDFQEGWYPNVAYAGREDKEWCGIFQKK